MPLVDEKWLPVAGFSGYLASPDGCIVSVKRKRPVLLRAWLDKDGYAMVPLRCDGVQIQSSVARIVCETFNGPPPSSAYVCCHNDGDKSNNSAANLRWATQAENIADKLKHGTHQANQKHGMATITDEQARAVKKAILEFGKHHGKLLHAVKVTGVPYHIVASMSRSNPHWRSV
ncbi:HNH endonuclease signature motif containing protein [Castellaniella denitrificans]|uniref:HNH endonuclease signature motif containing protein n=1 Tax=Castellaniella denitrificans TaxID=56119 RepID=UPI00361CBA48